MDVSTKQIFAYEALVRGLKGEGADEILSNLTDNNRYRFDQECRTKSILLAKQLNIKEYISINFLLNANYSPELCIRSTIAAAEKANFPLEKIIFEVTESEQIVNSKKLLQFLSIS